MCCLIAALFMLGPRAAIFIWWLIEPGRWSLAFDTVLWPIVGFLVAPWTTLMYLAVFPGGIDGSTTSGSASASPSTCSAGSAAATRTATGSNRTA